MSRLFGRSKPPQRGGSSNNGGSGGGAHQGSAGSRGWDINDSLNVVLEDSKPAVVATGGGDVDDDDDDGANEPSSRGSKQSLHLDGAAGGAGPTNSDLCSLSTSEGSTGGNDSMSRMDYFSIIASLPPGDERTSLRNSGMFSPQHRQKPQNVYGRRSLDE